MLYIMEFLFPDFYGSYGRVTLCGQGAIAGVRLYVSAKETGLGLTFSEIRFLVIPFMSHI
jgi:hypothetical protein